jgi:Xaa-Pro aminopeptidase
VQVTKSDNDRLNRIQRLLVEKECSHILITDGVDGEYLSGFHSSNFFLLVSRVENILFTDFRYKEAAAAFCARTPRWRFVQTSENGLSSLASHCPAGSRVGIQSNALSVDRFDEMRRRLKKVRFVKMADSIEAVFIPKLPAELSLAARAARIGDAAFMRAIKRLKTGITERDAAALLEEYCRRLGSEKPSFDAIVLFGARAALPHGVPSKRRLKKGDWVLMDFGCTVGGFTSDMTRTIVMGKAAARQRRVYEVVARAQQNARNAVREGVTARSVDARARTHIEQAGYGDYFGHATGHGLGRRVHEKPRIARENNAVLPEGAIITIEPGIYIPGFGGVRIEDMVIVRKNGPETITAAPRHLMEIEA